MGHDVYKNKKTKVFLEEYKGNKTLSIWEVDSSGEKWGRTPIISFGKSKASAILNHLEEVKKFVSPTEEDL